jgi:hypothetical protein
MTTTDKRAAAPSKETAAPFTKSQAHSTDSNDCLQAVISWFDSVKEPTPSDTCTLPEWVGIVRSNQYRPTVEKIRAIMATLPENFTDAELKAAKKKTDPIKKTLPAVTFSASMDTRAGDVPDENRNYQHTGILQIDVDIKDNIGTPMDEIRQRLMDHPSMIMVASSPSGGIKAAIAIPANLATHKQAFTAAKASLAVCGVNIDGGTHDLPRLCFLTHDPEAWLRDEPPVVLDITTESSDEPPDEPPKASKEEAPKGSSAKPRERLKPDTVRDMLALIPPRPIYKEWLIIASAVWDALGEHEGTAALCEWSPEEHGEYTEKYPHRLKKVTAGTLVHIARENGWNGIPEDVFPIPGCGVSYTEAAEIIFPAMGEARKLFIREREVHEIHSTVESDILAPVSPERFSSLVETTHRRVARREVKTKDGEDSVVWRTTTFPSSSAKILLQTDSARTALPPISQLANCPILTPDGHVLSRGYHKHGGGTYIGRGGKLQEVPFDTAVESLFRLLADFDFATASDASRAFASLISPALKQGRWIEDDFPLDLAEADQSQSGKTFRQKIVCLIYNEQQYSITSQKGGVGSLDEAVAAALIKGRPFITIDNFRGRMDSQIMEAAIRGAGVVDCRTIKHRAEVNTSPFLWQLSTNGAELTRDLANRSIVTRIRKRPDGIVWHPHPEGSLEAHIRANQCFYLACVFAILREWNRQGKPITDESRHDFRTWCRTLDGIVQMVDMPPLLDGHREQQLRTSNPNLQWLREILLAADVQDLSGELYASDLVRIAEDNDITFPGDNNSQAEPAHRAGRILKMLFKDAVDERIEVDGIEFTRTIAPDYSPNGGGRECKKYTVKKP